MKTSITLLDRDLAKLADSDEPDVRAEALAACDRLAAPARWPTIAPHVGELIVDVLREAREQGRLIYRGEYASRCRYCGARSEWKRLPRKRREQEIKVRCVEFGHRFVTIAGHVSVGACRECVEQALPQLRHELTAFPVELPTQLRTDGEPSYRRWELFHCKKCEWSGHEGELGRLRTLMGDGDYPGKCPSCGAERRFLGPDPFDRPGGFQVVEVTP